MSEQSLELDNDRGLLGAAVRRRWWLIAVLAVVFAVLGLAFGVLQPASYTATSTVLVKPVPGLPFSPATAGTTTGQNVTMTTEAALVTADPVLKAANTRLGTRITPGSGVVTATVPPNSQTIQVGFTAGSAANAQKGADTLARAFLDYRATQSEAVTKAKTATLQRQITATQTLLDAASKLASAAVPLPQAAGQVQLYSSTLVALQQNLADNQATSLDPGSVIAPAELPDSTRTLTVAIFGLGGLVLGALLGLGAAVAVAMRDRKLRGSESAVGGLPVIASATRGDDLTALGDRVRTAVLAASTLPATVGILSTDAAMALRLTTSLGDALAEAGYRVAVVEADPGSASADTGLGELLAGTGETTTPLKRRGAVSVLPGGRVLATSADLLSGPRMAQIVAGLRHDHDVVLLALPSCEGTLGLATARLADETVVVVSAKRTSSDTVVDLVRQSDLLDVKLLGLVIGSERDRGARRLPASPLVDDDVDEPIEYQSTPTR